MRTEHLPLDMFNQKVLHIFTENLKGSIKNVALIVNCFVYKHLHLTLRLIMSRLKMDGFDGDYACSTSVVVYQINRL